MYICIYSYKSRKGILYINGYQRASLVLTLVKGPFKKEDESAKWYRMMPSDELDCRAGFWCAVWCGSRLFVLYTSLHFVVLVSQFILTHNCYNRNHPKPLFKYIVVKHRDFSSEISLCHQCASGGFSKQDLRGQELLARPRAGPMHHRPTSDLGKSQISSDFLIFRQIMVPYGSICSIWFHMVPTCPNLRSLRRVRRVT